MPRANKTLRKLSERLLDDTANEPKALLEGSLLCEYVYRSYYISLTVEEATRVRRVMDGGKSTHDHHDTTLAIDAFPAFSREGINHEQERIKESLV